MALRAALRAAARTGRRRKVEVSFRIGRASRTSTRALAIPAGERTATASPSYAEYQAKTDREIPVFVLEPVAAD
ncbi:MAG: hypothetical protein NVS1B12_11170 [Acidimicrobiales bacterium]